MRNQFKIVLLVFVVLVTSLSVVVWKTQSLIVEDRVANLADMASKQIAPLRRLVQERLDEAKSQLIRFASVRAASSTAKYQAFAQYEVVSLVRPSENGKWASAWTEKASSAKQERWPVGYETVLLNTIPFARVKDGQVHWFRLSDAKGDPIYAVALTVEEPAEQAARAASASAQESLQTQLPESAGEGARPPSQGPGGRKSILIGFSSRNALAAVADDFIGSTSSVYIVDDRGFVTSHPNKTWVGANFTEDTIVQEILKSKKSTGTGQYTDMNSRSSVGHFEHIDRTNLTAIVMSPLVLMSGLTNAINTVALLTGLSIGLLGLLAAWYLGRSLPVVSRAQQRAQFDEVSEVDSQAESDRHDSGTNELPSLQKATAARNVATEAELSNERLAAERQAAFAAFNQGLSNEINEPILAILGHAQLAKAKSFEDEVRAHAESIEREARRAKNVLERLQGFGASQANNQQDVESIDLRTLVQSALQKMKVRLAEEDIYVQSDLSSVPVVRGQKVQVLTVLENLFDNAIEAMSFREDKKLTIKLALLGDHIYLSVQDNGVGMSRDVQARVFEPFYKNFDSISRVGLGLTYVQTVLKQMGGKCGVEAIPGEGATFTLDFPVALEDVRDFTKIQSEDSAGAVSVTHGEQAEPMSELPQTERHSEPGEKVPLNILTSLSMSQDFDSDEIDDFDHLEMDDEDDEQFASVPLGQAIKSSEGPGESMLDLGGGPAEDRKSPASTPSHSEFRVSIRRPKTKS